MKLVPQFFPKETGTATGLVGAFGGLGGFFPPLALGLIRDATGGYAWGFVFLACFALACLAVNYFVLARPRRDFTRTTVGDSPARVGPAPVRSPTAAVRGRDAPLFLGRHCGL